MFTHFTSLLTESMLKRASGNYARVTVKCCRRASLVRIRVSTTSISVVQKRFKRRPIMSSPWLMDVASSLAKMPIDAYARKVTIWGSSPISTGRDALNLCISCECWRGYGLGVPCSWTHLPYGRILCIRFGSATFRQNP